MNKANKLIRLSSIINLFLGVLTIKIPIYREILLISGFILFILSNEEYETISKKALYLIAIILLPFNIISSIIIFISSDNLKNNYNQINAPPAKLLDTENKKIDILLKLGIGMIFLSGILFATSSWNFINNKFKVIIILILALFFLVLSIFSEKKLKIFKTTFLYWFLSITFFCLLIVSILYFSIFGNYLTFQGLGKDLAYAITFFVIASLILATYLKFPKKHLIFIVFLSVNIMIYFLLSYFKFSNIKIYLIISLITILINIISKKETNIFNYNKTFSIILLAIFFHCLSENNNLILISGIINIFNNYILIIKDRENINLNLIISYLFLFLSIFNANIIIDFKFILTAILLSINILLIKFNILKLKENTTNLNYIFYTISILYLCLSNLYNDNFISIVIAIIYFIINLISQINYSKIKEIKLAEKLDPLSLTILTFTLLNSNIVKDLNIFTISGIFIIITMFLTFIHIILRNVQKKKIYFIYIIIGMFLSYLYLSEVKDFEIIILLIPAIYLFYILNSNKSDDKFKIGLSYINLNYIVYHIITKTNIFNIPLLTSSIIFIILLLIVNCFIKTGFLKNLTYFIIILPLFDILNDIFVYNELKIIIESITLLYLTFLATKFLFKTKDSKNIFAIIGIIISLQNVFYSSYLINLYVGMVGLIIIMIGYNNKELFAVFITGIIITILNILIALSNLWEEIPFWLYLLLGGLGIIIFVTYKELKKSKIK